jgi:O-antigen ligase
MGHVFKPISPFWATGSFDTRIVQGQAAIQVWSDNIWRGVGPSKIQQELMSEYDRINYRFGLKRRLNVHNQFLQYLSTYGFLGLLWLITAIIIGYRQNFLKSNIWIRKKGITWVLFFGSLLLTESYLERSLGITTWVLGWLWAIQESEDFVS